MLQRESVRAPQILPAASAQVPSKYEIHKQVLHYVVLCILAAIMYLNLLLYNIN